MGVGHDDDNDTDKNKAEAELQLWVKIRRLPGAGSERPPHPGDRQLRFVHLQPGAVPGRDLGHAGSRCSATTRSRWTASGEHGLTHLVVSPGPCTPDEAGISLEAIAALGGECPGPGGLPGPPVHRTGLRRQGDPGGGAGARQDLSHPPRPPHHLRRTAPALRGHPLPLAGASTATCRPCWSARPGPRTA